MLLFLAMRWAMKSCRGVSIRSGNKLLMVTLSATASRETDLQNAVSPVRAVVESAMWGLGLLTMADVMLTIRPKPRSRMPGKKARMSKIGANILLSNADNQAA